MPDACTDSAHPPLNEPAARRLIAALASPGFDAAPDSPRLPTLPGYILSRLLGRGGSSAVYLGFREGSERPLAIKILEIPLGSDAAATRRATRELDLLMAMRLPALTRLIDFGSQDGRLFMATEFIEGQRLDEACNALDRRARVALLAKVCDAVQSLHEHGVIHRDLKPSNILIDRQGKPVIIDLGIATLLSPNAADTLTAAGAPVGSPAFMAPEQARGERSGMSTRTDVYGLGATCFLLLTGHTPHDTTGPLADNLRRIAHDPPRPPRSLDPNLPKPLAAILEKSTATRPGNRYASAFELGADLRRWLSGSIITARNAGPISMVGRWIVQHPTAATLLLCLAMIVATALGVLATVVRFHSRPSAAVVTADHRAVELRAGSGRVLKRWSVPASSRVEYAELLDGSMSGDGRKRVAVWARSAPSLGGFSGRFSMVEAAAPWEPLWQTPVNGLTPPPEIRSLDRPTDPSYAVGSVRRADVFLEVPGDEFIVSLNNFTYSPSTVRVYSAAGKVLYERWHDGWIFDTRWLDGARRLVCTGVNSETTWEERGFGAVAGGAIVLFALDPKDRQTGLPVGRPELPAGASPLWYRWILPATTSEIFGDPALGPPRHHPEGAAFELRLITRDGRGAVMVDIDAEGSVAGPWVADDGFRAAYPLAFTGGDQLALSTSEPRRPRDGD